MARRNPAFDVFDAMRALGIDDAEKGKKRRTKAATYKALSRAGVRSAAEKEKAWGIYVDNYTFTKSHTRRNPKSGRNMTDRVTVEETYKTGKGYGVIVSESGKMRGPYIITAVVGGSAPKRSKAQRLGEARAKLRSKLGPLRKAKNPKEVLLAVEYGGYNSTTTRRQFLRDNEEDPDVQDAVRKLRRRGDDVIVGGGAHGDTTVRRLNGRNPSSGVTIYWERGGSPNYFTKPTLAEALKEVKKRLEDDPRHLYRFKAQQSTARGVADLGWGEVDADKGEIEFTNRRTGSSKLIRFKSPGKYAAVLFNDGGDYSKPEPYKIFSSYQQAAQWMMSDDGGLAYDRPRLLGTPMKVNGRRAQSNPLPRGLTSLYEEALNIGRELGTAHRNKGKRMPTRPGLDKMAKDATSRAKRRAGRGVKLMPVDRSIVEAKFKVGFKEGYEGGGVARNTNPGMASAAAQKLYANLRRQFGDDGADDAWYKLNTMPPHLWEGRYRFDKRTMTAYMRYRDREAAIGSRAPGAVPRMGNPSGSSMREADSLYESFHGKAPTRTTRIITKTKARTDFAELGPLVELKVHLLTGRKHKFSFRPDGRDAIMLCSDPSGQQLYFVGGNQEVDLRTINMSGSPWEKDSMVLGVLEMVTYRTEKGFDNFQLTDYYHELGEESGMQPLLTYDNLNQLLSVAGGQYEVRPEGITN